MERRHGLADVTAVSRRILLVPNYATAVRKAVDALDWMLLERLGEHMAVRAQPCIAFGET